MPGNLIDLALPAFSFDRGRRLLSPEAYRRVFSKPVRKTTQHFTMLARSNDGQQARLGLAISKKQARLAVDRNRVKRLTRESFRQHQQEIRGLDLVILARQGISGADNRRLFEELETLWRKAGAITR